MKKRNDGIYLGRVSKKEKHGFYSSNRDIFTYNSVTNVFEQADETYATDIPDDQRKHPEICLDFGDSYLVYELLNYTAMIVPSIPSHTETKTP